jgi:hypothetical protein
MAYKHVDTVEILFDQARSQPRRSSAALPGAACNS